MRSALLGVLLALCAVPAFGQCAMCYTGAAAASHGGTTALNRAILTLLVPPVGIMVGLVGLAFGWDRKRRIPPDAVAVEAPSIEEISTESSQEN